MIILHRNKNDEFGDELQQKLDSLVLAYEVQYIGEAKGDGAYIEESGKKYKSNEEITTWLNNLEKELNWQRSITGDGCYIDPESGKVC